MADVFISYKREDESRVGRLVAALEAQGLDVWWDGHIPPGAPWEATIEQALASARAVVVCWSRTAVTSENVRSEARVARNQDRLIQLFIEPCEPPLFFGERQGVDLTNWRGRPDDPRILALAEAIRAIGAGKAPGHPPLTSPGHRSSWLNRRNVLAAAIALLLVLVSGWLLLRPAARAGPVTLAVLPFRASSAADVNLSNAIADDTRSALGRNPHLLVLGRLAVDALARQGLAPQDYRRKVGADYLLDGSMQRAGTQLRIKVSLVRTEDGTELWADQFDGPIDDVFGFQDRVASEVEGRIRGRLAPGKGIRPENIVASGEVYAIYADARAQIRKRNVDGTREGIELLKIALAKDPNYAPAWAELGIATRLHGPTPGKPRDKIRQEAMEYLNRALTLAPNLALAHAGLAMVQDNPPELEPEVRRAVELDPNNAEAWMWLGNLYGSQNKVRLALEAHRRASEIEPLWISPIGNMIGDLTDLGDDQGIADLLARLDRTGDPILAAKARFFVALNQGRPGEAVRLGLKLRAEHPEEQSYIDARIARPMIQLGFVDEIFRVRGGDPSDARVYAGTPLPAEILRSSYERPIDLWLDDDAPMLWARLLPRHGRLEEFIGYYKAAFKSPEDFYNLPPGGDRLRFRAFAPNVAVLLRAAGEKAEADAILGRDSQVIATLLGNGPARALTVNLAQLRGAQGRDGDAVRVLEEAFAKGWLPDRQFEAADIADEPCFAGLVERADFQALRQRILARLGAERRIAAPAVAAAKL